MSTTRDRVIRTLLNRPKSSVNELAEAVGINAISVRHHVSSLLADGLLIMEEVRHGVGRPRQVYSLSDKGMERFGSRYLSLTTRLLGQIKDSLPKTTVLGLFESIATEIAGETKQIDANLPIEKRLDLLQDLLAKEGFSIDWNREGDDYIIRESTCPYFHIGQTHPEVCIVDQTIITKVLGIPASQVNCVLAGDNHCLYRITPTSRQEG